MASIRMRFGQYAMTPLQLAIVQVRTSPSDIIAGIYLLAMSGHQMTIRLTSSVPTTVKNTCFVFEQWCNHFQV